MNPQMHPQSQAKGRSCTDSVQGICTDSVHGPTGFVRIPSKKFVRIRFYKPRCSNLPCTDSVQSPNPKNRQLSAICSLLVPADVRNPYATIWTPMIFKNSPPALMTLRPSQNGRAGVAQDLPRQPSRTLPGNPRMHPKARLQMHPQNETQMAPQALQRQLKTPKMHPKSHPKTTKMTPRLLKSTSESHNPQKILKLIPSILS